MIDPRRVATDSALRRLARRVDNHLLREPEWHVGVVASPIHAFIGAETCPEVAWLPRPAAGTFLADPFALQQGERIHLFCEQYERRTGRGRIAHLAIVGTRIVSAARPILQLPTHMSYPCVFEHDNRLYCVPETSHEREVALYVCQTFPDVWNKVGTLISGRAAVDASVVQYEGRWWMFFTDVDDQENARLFIGHAPDLRGPWEPHARNPVKSDPRSARPAGRLFVHDGALFRPAQDCSLTYGQQVVLNRVARLTPEEFDEDVVGVIRPDRRGPYPHGLHTVCGVGDVTIVDGKRLVPNTRALLRRTLAHARRVASGPRIAQGR